MLPKSCQAASDKEIRLTISAAQQEGERLFRQILHRILVADVRLLVGLTTIRHDGVRGHTETGPRGPSAGYNDCRRRPGNAVLAIAGSVMRVSATIRSEARDSWILTTRIIGVGCGKPVDEFIASAELHNAPYFLLWLGSGLGTCGRTPLCQVSQHQPNGEGSRPPR